MPKVIISSDDDDDYNNDNDNNSTRENDDFDESIRNGNHFRQNNNMMMMMNNNNSYFDFNNNNISQQQPSYDSNNNSKDKSSERSGPEMNFNAPVLQRHQRFQEQPQQQRNSFNSDRPSRGSHNNNNNNLLPQMVLAFGTAEQQNNQQIRLQEDSSGKQFRNSEVIGNSNSNNIQQNDDSRRRQRESAQEVKVPSPQVNQALFQQPEEVEENDDKEQNQQQVKSQSKNSNRNNDDVEEDRNEINSSPTPQPQNVIQNVSHQVRDVPHQETRQQQQRIEILTKSHISSLSSLLHKSLPSNVGFLASSALDVQLKHNMIFLQQKKNSSFPELHPVEKTLASCFQNSYCSLSTSTSQQEQELLLTTETSSLIRKKIVLISVFSAIELSCIPKKETLATISVQVSELQMGSWARRLLPKIQNDVRNIVLGNTNNNKNDIRFTNIDINTAINQDTRSREVGFILGKYNEKSLTRKEREEQRKFVDVVLVADNEALNIASWRASYGEVITSAEASFAATNVVDFTKVAIIMYPRNLQEERNFISGDVVESSKIYDKLKMDGWNKIVRVVEIQ